MNVHERTVVPIEAVGIDMSGTTRRTFEVSGIGYGHILFDNVVIIDPHKEHTKALLGAIIPSTGERDSVVKNIVTPTVSLNVQTPFSEMSNLYCALQIDGQEFVSDPVEGDALPGSTDIHYYHWKIPNEIEESNLILPSSLNKLQQVVVRFWTVDPILA